MIYNERSILTQKCSIFGITTTSSYKTLKYEMVYFDASLFRNLTQRFIESQRSSTTRLAHKSYGRDAVSWYPCLVPM